MSYFSNTVISHQCHNWRTLQGRGCPPRSLASAGEEMMFWWRDDEGLLTDAAPARHLIPAAPRRRNSVLSGQLPLGLCGLMQHHLMVSPSSEKLKFRRMSKVKNKRNFSPEQQQVNKQNQKLNVMFCLQKTFIVVNPQFPWLLESMMQIFVRRDLHGARDTRDTRDRQRDA